jgi:hypothetical protein
MSQYLRDLCSSNSPLKINYMDRGLPMTEELYFLKCYLKKFETTVKKVIDDKFVVLDRTAFYPEVRKKKQLL